MWHDAKQLVKSASGLNDVILHIVLGAVLFLVIATLTRRPVLALLMIAGIAVTNEAVDLVEDATGSGWLGSIDDILWTLLVPATALVGLKFLRVKAMSGK
jgi:hypothetical protein